MTPYTNFVTYNDNDELSLRYKKQSIEESFDNNNL